jgi:hypothetical protein
VYSVSPLSPGDDQGQKPDRIVFEGTIYEIKNVEPWGDGAAGYCKAVAVYMCREPH